MASVYISSTFSDLKQCRKAVYDALRRLGHDVISMEDYNAAPRRPLDVCLRDVARCELYVGIFAWRYGFVPDSADPARPDASNADGKSITELEYLHAVANRKDCLIFLLHPDAPWPVSQVEEGDGAKRIRALRAKLGNDHTVAFFNDASDLEAKASTAVAVWQEQRQRQSSDSAPPPKEKEQPAGPEVNIARLPVTGVQLFGRDEQLGQLDEAWSDEDTTVFSLIAWGGVGKSALVNHWLRRRMLPDDYRGAERVYAWSFYRQGTSEQGVSADQFVDAALRWFGDPDPTAGTPWDKGERLARLVGGRRTLMLLDGLEPLQFPPGRGHQEGALKEHSMQALLRGLAAHNPGLCVITSRLAVADLADSEGVTTRRVNLEHLSPQAGAEVLRGQGAVGERSELEIASAEFGGHALALTLLGSYLKNVHDGDIARRDRVDILREDEERAFNAQRSGHAQRVMASYESWFGEGPELDVLRMIALFDRPADGLAIDALRAAPAIANLTDALQGFGREDWRPTLNRLRAAKLIADRDPNHPDTLDAHPLVREYFKRQLKRSHPDAWREGNSRLYEHLRDTTKEFPDTIEEMAPLYAAVAHGCEAGRHQEALDGVYWARIQRSDKYFSRRNLGASGAELAALAGFFDPPWHQPVLALTESDKAFVLTEAGYVLRSLGRLAEALQPLQASLESRGQQKDDKNAFVSCINLSQLCLNMGTLTQSLAYAQQAVELADKIAGEFQRMVGKATLADTLYHAGRLSEAESIFHEAEAIWKGAGYVPPLLYSLPGFAFCSLLLHQGKYREVQIHATQTLESGIQAGDLLSMALDNLSLGKANLLQARQEAGDLTPALDNLNRAVNGLRQVGTLHHLPLGLIARARLYRVKGRVDRARFDLDEAMSIATRGSMGLHQADCHLEYARLYLAGEPRDVGKAREHLLKAREMIGRMGYHLRDEAVRELEAQLKEADG